MEGLNLPYGEGLEPSVGSNDVLRLCPTWMVYSNNIQEWESVALSETLRLGDGKIGI